MTGRTRAHVHLNLDDAWEPKVLGMPTLDARQWGPRLRCFARAPEIEEFFASTRCQLGPYVLYGSGDFHHLAALFVRHIAAADLTIVSFDNHPDWDIRPPKWACGGWVNRALELPHVLRVSVWGCGNFELRFPASLVRNRSNRIDVNAWAERQPAPVVRRFNCMTRENWRERFEHFADSRRCANVYVTVDLDCLRADEAVTNWENGLFTTEDVAWAISMLRERAHVVGGDLCGAYSIPLYARRRQRFAAEWDRPKLPKVDAAEARHINRRALETIWPALCGRESTAGHERDPRTDEHDSDPPARRNALAQEDPRADHQQRRVQAFEREQVTQLPLAQQSEPQEEPQAQ
jgi:hypothetical protein